MTSRPQITFLIVSWNAWHDLRRGLHSLKQLDFADYEILVIDNGSTDETVDQVQKYFPEVQLHQNTTNLGLPKAVNLGIKKARGEYIMLLDADTEVDPEAATLLYEFMQQHPEVSLAAPRIFSADGKIEESARNLPSVMSGLFGRQSVLTRWMPNNPFSKHYLLRSNLQTLEPFQVEQVSAASMFFRKSIFHEVGPWDEGYRCYWVDTDWCARLRRLKKLVYCVPTAQVTHYENNRSDNRKSPWRIWHFHLGALRLYRKHYTFGHLDPRTWFAGAALASRSGLLLFFNELKPRTNQAWPMQHRPDRTEPPVEVRDRPSV